MKNKCIICGKDLENESNVCDTCFEVLKTKYPDKKQLKKVLKWHEKHLKKQE